MQFRRIPVILLLLAGCASAPSFAPAPGSLTSQPPAAPVTHAWPFPRRHDDPPVPVNIPRPIPAPPPSAPPPPVDPPPVDPPPPPVDPPPVSRIPDNAVSSGILDGSPKWKWHHDLGTPGTSVGTTEWPVAGVSADNAAREYELTYTDYGGELWSVLFARDTAATHFVYDTYVYLADPSEVANLEMDMNQVMANDDTVIFGMQCASGTKTWEYTTTTGGRSHWSPSNLYCNPKTWSATWHHVQIASERDAYGNVVYDWINLDGTYSDFVGAAGNSARALGWNIGTLLLNFQIDGASKTGGALTAYTDQMQVWRW